MRELTSADVRGLLPRGARFWNTHRGRFVERNVMEWPAQPEEIYREACANLSVLY